MNESNRQTDIRYHQRITDDSVRDAVLVYRFNQAKLDLSRIKR
jgi:hypothetical protein